MKSFTYNHKHTKLLTLLLAASLICLLPACGEQDSNIQVKTAAAASGQIDGELTVTGALVPENTADVSAAISGKVVSINVAEGSIVSQGQVLATLDGSQLNAQLEQAQASYAATADTAAQAKIVMDSAKQTLDTTASLYAAGAVAKSKLDADQDSYNIAKSKYEASTGAGAAQAKASIDAVRSQMGNTVVKSPISGIITNKNINSGETATMGKALFTIADTRSLSLKGTISQDYLPYIAEGQQVDISVDIYPEQVFSGTVKAIAAMSVSTGSYFPIEISMVNNDNIASGLSAQASIKMKGTSHILVPLSAVVTNNGESNVFVIKDGVCEKRIVTTGLRNDKQIEILKGLSEGETVAATNANNLFDQMPVSIQKD